MTFKYGKASEGRLNTCSDVPRLVMNKAIEFMDITIACGHRGPAEQGEAYRTGASQLQWPDSVHNQMPSDAVDAYPYDPKYGMLTGSHLQIQTIAVTEKCTMEEARAYIHKRFGFLAGLLLSLTDRYAPGWTLRWGGDWDMDGNYADQKFHDLPHFEWHRKV